MKWKWGGAYYKLKMREVGDDEPTATTATTGATMREVVGGDQQKATTGATMREVVVVGGDQPKATTGATMREVVGGDQQATLFCERGRKEEC
jgi:hypothetical protein